MIGPPGFELWTSCTRSMLPVLLLFHAFKGVSTPSIDSGSPCPLNTIGAESAFSHTYRTALDSGYANPTKTERGRLGPYWNRYGSNPAVLADQIGDDPPVLDNAKLLHRNRRDLSAPKATAEQDRKDGAVPFAPNCRLAPDRYDRSRASSVPLFVPNHSPT